MSDKAQEEVGAGRKRLIIALVSQTILAAIGLVIAMELTDVYVRARTDPDYQSFCAVSEGMNCETVALSDYSTFMGAPVSVWGAAGYLFALFLALLCLVRAGTGFGRGFMLLLALAFVGASAVLVYVMTGLIGSVCILCVALDVVNAGMLAMAWFGATSSGQPLGRMIADDFLAFVRAPVWPLLLVVVGVAIFAGGWSVGTRIAASGQMLPQLPLEHGESSDSLPHATPGEWTKQLDQQCGEECPCKSNGGEIPTTHMGVEDGHPWVGRQDAPLVIHEFTDYECPYCRQAHLKVRQLLSNNPGQVKVFHRHYPLDQACNRRLDRPFHKRACELSRIAYCAGRQGRFWEMNDFLFQHAAEIKKENWSAQEIASRLELSADQFSCCLDDVQTVEAVKKDIEAGIGLALKGTPAFLVDGKVYYGKIPEEAMGRLGPSGPGTAAPTPGSARP
jgi:protein-disulfide isomerase/uncharacterized membrane protein